MRTLFTPWRFAYLTAPAPDNGCIFCVAAARDDREATLTLYRDDDVIVMMNKFPYTNGHLMVAPVVHTARLTDSSDEILAALIRTTAVAQRILSEVYGPHGFNIGMNIGSAAGAGIADHYHMHIVPRWGGDSNFMTVTAATRLVPEDLGVTFAKLRPRFGSLEVGRRES
ncbi:MAG: HIT domain-containing protein [Acidobacteria bacterium]|nr:HIT domain-containing protein [Acidobacteriota bacterium]